MITYEIFRDGERIVKMSDENAEAQYFSQQRIVLIRRLPIERLEPGPYTLNIAAEDLVKDETATTSVRFEVQAPPQAGTN